MWDLTDVKEDSGDFKPLAVGDYLVACDGAQVNVTKSGTGEYISLSLKVLEGEAEGRKVFATFNTANANPVAVDIGMKQLKGYMKACKMTDFKLTDVNALVGHKVVAHVKQETYEGVVRNKVSYFKEAKGTENPF